MPYRCEDCNSTICPDCGKHYCANECPCGAAHICNCEYDAAWNDH